jgi:hypothetical protein
MAIIERSDSPQAQNKTDVNERIDSSQAPTEPVKTGIKVIIVGAGKTTCTPDNHH